jgi:hypothetical protein
MPRSAKNTDGSRKGRRRSCRNAITIDFSPAVSDTPVEEGIHWGADFYRDSTERRKNYEIYETTDCGAEQRSGNIRGRMPGERYRYRILDD